jgi:hypothetical protein
LYCARISSSLRHLCGLEFDVSFASS